WRGWHWSLWAAALLIMPFLLIDLTFLSANLLKVFEGGWVPLALGGAVMTVMYTWRRGTRLLFEKTRRLEMPLDSLVASLERRPPGCPRAGAARRSGCRARPSFSPAIPRAPPRRCCTASSTTRCCTKPM